MNEIAKKRVVVMIPTYNEAENIGSLVRAILDLPMDADIAVVVADDDSPDGTGRIVEGLAREDGRVHALIRKKRRGRGAGGIDGFKAALGLRPDYVVEMDGDLSHQPRFIPDLVQAMKNCDVAIGSRFIKGGKDADRGLHRRLLTALVRRFLRSRFRFPIKDVHVGLPVFSNRGPGANRPRRHDLRRAVHRSRGPLQGLAPGIPDLGGPDRVCRPEAGKDQAQPPDPPRDDDHGHEDQAAIQAGAGGPLNGPSLGQKE